MLQNKFPSFIVLYSTNHAPEVLDWNRVKCSLTKLYVFYHVLPNNGRKMQLYTNLMDVQVLKQANFSSVLKRIQFPVWTMQLRCNTPRYESV